MLYFIKCIFLILPITVFCQDTNFENFDIVNRKIIYTKVFEIEEATAEDLQIYFIQQMNVFAEKTNEYKNEITGKFLKKIIDYKKYGGSNLDTMTFIRSPMSGEFSIQFKDGKYRVIVQNIVFHSNISYNFYGVSTNENNITKIEAIFIKNNKDSFRKNLTYRDGLYYMSKNIEEWFSIKLNPKISNDW